MTTPDRRTRAPRPETDLYALKNIQHFIKKERRHDERSRLTIVQQQRRTWLVTILFCGGMNLLLIALAIWGAIK